MGRTPKKERNTFIEMGDGTLQVEVPLCKKMVHMRVRDTPVDRKILASYWCKAKWMNKNKTHCYAKLGSMNYTDWLSMMVPELEMNHATHVMDHSHKHPDWDVMNTLDNTWGTWINPLTNQEMVGNLRVITWEMNAVAKCMFSNNTSGTTGVSFDKEKNAWLASWRENGKWKHEDFSLSRYASSEDAKAAAIYCRKLVERTKKRYREALQVTEEDMPPPPPQAIRRKDCGKRQGSTGITCFSREYGKSHRWKAVKHEGGKTICIKAASDDTDLLLLLQEDRLNDTALAALKKSFCTVIEAYDEYYHTTYGPDAFEMVMQNIKSGKK